MPGLLVHWRDREAQPAPATVEALLAYHAARGDDLARVRADLPRQRQDDEAEAGRRAGAVATQFARPFRAGPRSRGPIAQCNAACQDAGRRPPPIRRPA